MTVAAQTKALAEREVTITRVFDAPRALVFKAWTDPQHLAQWWGPEGFYVKVRKLDLRPGGELIYTFTATAPEQVEFMKKAGMPLTTEAHKTFTELARPKRIAYNSVVDFVPGVKPYDQLTVVDLSPSGDGVRVVMTADPMHDDVWTQRLVMGRENELNNLGKVIERLRA